MERITSEPKRARAASARQAATGCALPLAAIASSGSYSKTRSVARNVSSPTATASTGA
jgi:hypothetical protein